MSTNFYMETGEDTFHIGKATNVMGEYGITTFSGTRFNSLDDMYSYIETQAETNENFRIVDEYGSVQRPEVFLRRYFTDRNPLMSAMNIGTLQADPDLWRDHMGVLGYDVLNPTRYWIDPETYALFLNAEFN